MAQNSEDINFWQGNQACAEAALKAGCRFFAGYPITPASEIAEIMAQKLPSIDGTYIQMEDEISALSAIIGASWGGHLSMTATSGPGFSLMQENIGYAIMTETPCVIVDVQRAGPSTGQATKAAQGDLMQTRWGTHGDHNSIVLTPNSAQETFELTIRAFEISEKLRHPVIVLSDEIIAHSREKVIIDKTRDYEIRRKHTKKGDAPYSAVNKEGDILMPKFGTGQELLITGSTHDEIGFRKTSDADTHNELVRRIVTKVEKASEYLTDCIIKGPKTAEWGIVSFGCTSRSVEEIMMQSDKSIRSLRLRTIWPFPDDTIKRFSETVDRLFVPELNLGQLSLEVSRVVPESIDVVEFNKIGGGLMIEPEEMLDAMRGS